MQIPRVLQEGWKTKPDTGHQWSHCAVAPLYITYQGLAGIRPLAPGFKRVELRPQLADLDQLELTAHTVRGPLQFSAHGKLGVRTLTVELPKDCEGELVLPAHETVSLPRLPNSAPNGCVRYQIPHGGISKLQLTAV